MFQPERVPGVVSNGMNITFQPEHVPGVVSNGSDHYVSAGTCSRSG